MADLVAQHAPLRADIEAGVRSVLDSGCFVLGPQLDAFEREVADWLGVAHAVGCGSGTDALALALRALGIGAGDEVVTTPFTFFATVEAIVQVGATPVFADIAADGLALDPARVEDAIGPATRAILPVHLFGRAAAMDALADIAARHGLHLLEDCAQSLGARSGGRITGSIGAAGAFSFYPSKNLGACGDAGLVTTGCEALARSLRSLRNHGASASHRHERIGVNSRLDELQAMVLRVKLPHVHAWTAARRRIAQRYRQRLAGLPGLQVPASGGDGEHVFHHYTVLVPERDALRAALAAQGIASAVHYPVPLHRQPALAGLHAGALPVAEHVAAHCLSLPIYPELGEDAVERVADALHAALARPAHPAPAAR